MYESMYESSGSQFFRTTTGVQSGINAFDESRFVMTFLTILCVTEILCSFRFVLEGKTGKEIPKSSKLEFLEKILANNFALSDTEENTSGLLNRGGIADLPLMRMLMAICQKSWEPSFWEAMYSCFISICKFGNLKNSFAMITILSELYFRFRRSILLIQINKQKRDLYELWQQYRQLKTIEMREAWPGTYGEGYIHQFQPEFTHKIY